MTDISELAQAQPGLVLAVKVAITVWMVAVSWIDLKTARIPNWLVGPVMLGVGAVRLVEGVVGCPMSNPGPCVERFFLLLAWVLIFGLWMVHFIGGGDAKFLMGEYALFPYMEFTAVLAFVLLIETIPLVLIELVRGGVRGSAQGLKTRLITGQLLPTRRELEERGKQYAWTFAVPGILFTWLYW